MRANSKRSGFTLIEMMVVMAIVIVLAGIILPVAQKLRGSGYALKCISNMNAIGKALLSYQIAYEGWMPYVLEETGRQDRGRTYADVLTAEDNALIWKYEISFIQNNLSPQDRDSKDFCLSRIFFDPVKGKGNGNYFLSKRHFGARLQVKVAGSSIGVRKWEDYFDYVTPVGERDANESEQVALQKHHRGYMPFRTWEEPSRAAILAPSKDPNLQRGLGKEGSQVNIDYRHGGEANILFLDGHVEQFKEGDDRLFDLFDAKFDLRERTDGWPQLHVPPGIMVGGVFLKKARSPDEADKLADMKQLEDLPSD